MATLDIFAEDDVITVNREKARLMGELAAELDDLPHVAEVRQHGMILAAEMIKNKPKREPFPWQERRGLQVYRYGLEQGVLLRPLGNVIYFMPPYIIDPPEIERMIRVARDGIRIATQH